MEGKVSQNGDILIEEMIEKLKKVSGGWGGVSGPGLPSSHCFPVLPGPVTSLALCTKPRFHNMWKGNMGKTHFTCKIYRMRLVCEETGFLPWRNHSHTTFLLFLFFMGWFLETDVTREELNGKKNLEQLKLIFP